MSGARVPGTNGRTALGYTSAPVPSHVVAAFLRGEIACDDFALLAYLYDCANYERLARREPSVRRTLRQLADALHLDVTDNALSKRLRRLRDRGYLSWTVERLPGRPQKGRDVYAFTLHPEGPSEARRPSSGRDDRAAARPSSDGAQDGAASGVAEPGTVDVAEFQPGAEAGSMAELPADLAEFPTAATPLPEPVSGEVGSAAWPSSSDVQSRANPSRTTTDAEGARARDDLAGLVPEVRESILRHRAEQSPEPTGVHDAIERAQLAQVRAAEAERAAARERTLRLAEELPDREGDVVRELVQTFDAVLVSEDDAAREVASP